MKAAILTFSNDDDMMTWYPAMKSNPFPFTRDCLDPTLMISKDDGTPSLQSLCPTEVCFLGMYSFLMLLRVDMTKSMRDYRPRAIHAKDVDLTISRVDIRDGNKEEKAFTIDTTSGDLGGQWCSDTRVSSLVARLIPHDQRMSTLVPEQALMMVYDITSDWFLDGTFPMVKEIHARE